MDSKHKTMNCRLGVDFDNTLVSYDDLMHKQALRLGLITADVDKTKKAIRDNIRQLPDGERQWQKLQAFAYGKGMDGAVMFEGAKEFFRMCRKAGIPVYIVSHKTKFATLDEDGTNLRERALLWMKKNGFFETDGMSLTQDRVYFESTPEEKIMRIAKLGCTHFIDDLQEVFLKKIFPEPIKKILFASPENRSSNPLWKAFGTWSEISEYFQADVISGLKSNELNIVEQLLGESVESSSRIGGGSNSRVYHFQTERAKQFIVKFYFHQDTDRRDRLDAEYTSLSFLWRQGLQCIPKPVAVNKKERCAVYQFIEGEKIDAKEVTADDIDQAVTFLSQLKLFTKSKGSHQFHPASEAHYSVAKIVENIEWRLKRLENEVDDGTLQDFLKNELKPFFSCLVSWCKNKSDELGISYDSEIDVEDRTLSPSDFGFHNALKEKDGRIVFLDFEYFGWDDPAKMISDFLLHPAVAFDQNLKIRFMDEICAVFKENARLCNRVEIVYPLFAFKWCLIFLNEFIPNEMRRRDFAQANSDNHRRLQKEQLSKARSMLGFVKNIYQDFPYKEKICQN